MEKLKKKRKKLGVRDFDEEEMIVDSELEGIEGSSTVKSNCQKTKQVTSKKAKRVC